MFTYICNNRSNNKVLKVNYGLFHFRIFLVIPFPLLLFSSLVQCYFSNFMKIHQLEDNESLVTIFFSFSSLGLVGLDGLLRVSKSLIYKIWLLGKFDYFCVTILGSWDYIFNKFAIQIGLVKWKKLLCRFHRGRMTLLQYFINLIKVNNNLIVSKIDMYVYNYNKTTYSA